MYMYFKIGKFEESTANYESKTVYHHAVALHLKPSIDQYQVFNSEVLNHYYIVQLTLDYLQKPIHNQNTKM